MSICQRWLSISEQCSDNDRNVISSDCSESAAMSVDSWLNLNAITYCYASSWKRDYFIPFGRAYMSKYPLSLEQERKMSVLRKAQRRSREDWM